MLAQRVDNALSEVVGILHGITKADIDSTDSAGDRAPDSHAMAATPAEQDGRRRSSKLQRNDATESGQTELIKLTEPTWGFTVRMPACSLSGVAHPLLTATAEEHGEPLEVEDGAGRRSTSVQLNTFLSIGRAAAPVSSASSLSSRNIEPEALATPMGSGPCTLSASAPPRHLIQDPEPGRGRAATTTSGAAAASPVVIAPASLPRGTTAPPAMCRGASSSTPDSSVTVLPPDLLSMTCE